MRHVEHNVLVRLDSRVRNAAERRAKRKRGGILTQTRTATRAWPWDSTARIATVGRPEDLEHVGVVLLGDYGELICQAELRIPICIEEELSQFGLNRPN